MTTQEWIMFVLTFLTGVFIGFYVYVTFFKPIYDADQLASSESAASEFSIIGKQYGGARGPEYVHASFRLLENGSYQYVPGGSGDQVLEQQTGKLPSSLVRDLKSLATQEVFESLSGRVVKEECRLYQGGIDYIYRVTLNQVEYILDTCGTAINYQDPLAIELEKIWNWLENPDSVGGMSGNTLYDIMENYLKKQFGTD